MKKDQILIKKDKTYLEIARRLSIKNLGATSYKPSVGCLIVKNDEIIATGTTLQNGTSHAESEAITKALGSGNGNLENSIMYVTLEPCSHFGQTAPCSDLIIKHKIGRVVIGQIDPDPRVNGSGMKKMQQAGIKVETLSPEKSMPHQEFVFAKINKRPLVSLKLATSLDGKIALNNGQSKWITGAVARNYGHRLRANHDAILVGGKTIRKDNPRLNCRLPGLDEYSPIKIILSNSLDFDQNSQVFLGNKLTILATNNLDNARFSGKNIKIIHYSSLENLLEKLQENGINSLLIEGGALTASSFLKNNLVERIFHFSSSKIIGADGVHALGTLGLTNLNNCPNFSLAKTKELGEDLLRQFNKNND